MVKIAMDFRVDTCFKPYVRMTQKGKWVKPEAQAYLSSQHEIAHAFKAIMALNEWTMIPRGTSLDVTVIIHHGHGFNNRDLDNEVKAIMDAAQGVVFEDDRWIDHLDAWRTRRATGCGFLLYVHDWVEEDD